MRAVRRNQLDLDGNDRQRPSRLPRLGMVDGTDHRVENSASVNGEVIENGSEDDSF